MCEELTRDPQAIIARLNAMVGQPHRPPNGCLKFLQRALLEFGIQIGDNTARMDARQFRRVDGPSLGTVVIFKNIQFLEDDVPFHVGLMLDKRMCIQSSKNTNGVGRVDITRIGIKPTIKGFYRHKSFR